MAAKAGKVLIFHIGDHKTGSTTLQNLFATGQLRLKNEALLYPGNLNHNYLLGQFRSELRRFAALRRSALPRPNKTAFALESLPKGNPNRPNLPRLREMIAQTKARYIVLSGEEFENIAPVNLKFVLDHWLSDLVDEIRIIAYVRPHAARFVSNYTELLKIGEFRGDMEDYLALLQTSKRFHFAQRFERWKANFGEAFTLRPMIRSQLAQGSVVEDFMITAFPGEAFEIGQSAAANESLGLRDLMVLKFIQERFDLAQTDKFYRHTMGRELTRYLGSLLPVTGGAEKLVLHRGLAGRIFDFYRADAQKLDALFFEEGALFEAALEEAVFAAKEEPMSLEPAHYFSQGELRRLGALREVLWNMLQTDKNWAHFFHENRVRALHKDTGVRDTASKP